LRTFLKYTPPNTVIGNSRITDARVMRASSMSISGIEVSISSVALLA